MTTYRPGREWFTDCSSQTRDAACWDLWGLTYTVDQGLPALHLSTPGVLGSIRTKDRCADVDVLAKVRIAPEGVYSIVNVFAQLAARYADMGNYWRGGFITSTGNNQLQGTSFALGAGMGTAGTGVGSFDNTDSTKYRWLRMQVTGDCLRMKWWFAGAFEPAWQIVQRLRPPTGGVSPQPATDNVELGAAGFLTQYGGYLQSLKVTELVRVDSDLLWYPSPGEMQTGPDAFPVGWYPMAPGSSDVSDVVSVQTRCVVRPVFHLHKASTDRSLLWTQDLWRGGSPNAFLARKMPAPRAVFPQRLRVSVWSKGAAVQSPGTLASAFVAYYYDDQGTVLNFNQPDYYATLGPHGAVGGANGKKGDGDWTWRETYWTMHLEHWERCTRMRVQFGLHDPGSTGDLWVSDLSMTPTN